MNQMPEPCHHNSRLHFTQKQGQYLAFIYAYSLLNGRPPSEGDLQKYFRVTPPTVHQMVLKLESEGLISRLPGTARSIRLRIEPELLPILRPPHAETVKTTVQSH